MPKVVSIIPSEKDDDSGAHLTRGTKILLDDGSYLQGVVKVVLVAESNDLWKAIIEVHPTNQQQIDAVIQDIKTIGSDPDQYQYEI